MSAGTAAAVHAAAAIKRRNDQEEETLTRYTAEELNGWEFKIVRSPFGKFKNPETLRMLCLEEAKNGWEMLEKFDDQRIRFKRKTERRSGDSGAGVDPYRTRVGPPDAAIALMVIAAIALIVGVIVLFAPR